MIRDVVSRGFIGQGDGLKYVVTRGYTIGVVVVPTAYRAITVYGRNDAQKAIYGRNDRARTVYGKDRQQTITGD